MPRGALKKTSNLLHTCCTRPQGIIPRSPMANQPQDGRNWDVLNGLNKGVAQQAKTQGDSQKPTNSRTLSYTFHLAVEQRSAEIVMRTRKGRVPVCQSINTACTWYHGPQGLINLKSKPRTKLQYALQNRGCDPWEPAWLLDRPRVFFQQFRIYQENCKNPRQPIPLGWWVWVKMFNAQKKLDVFRSKEKWQALNPPDRWSCAPPRVPTAQASHSRRPRGFPPHCQSHWGPPQLQGNGFIITQWESPISIFCLRLFMF